MALQAEKNAKSIVRELEDAKLAGIDYPVSSLINLRQVGSPCIIQAYVHSATGKSFNPFCCIDCVINLLLGLLPCGSSSTTTTQASSLL